MSVSLEFLQLRFKFFDHTLELNFFCFKFLKLFHIFINFSPYLFQLLIDSSFQVFIMLGILIFDYEVLLSFYIISAKLNSLLQDLFWSCPIQHLTINKTYSVVNSPFLKLSSILSLCSSLSLWGLLKLLSSICFLNSTGMISKILYIITFVS